MATAIIPKRRSLIRDRNRLKRLRFFDPGSRFAWPNRRSAERAASGIQSWL